MYKAPETARELEELGGAGVYSVDLWRRALLEAGQKGRGDERMRSGAIGRVSTY